MLNQSASVQHQDVRTKLQATSQGSSARDKDSDPDTATDQTDKISVSESLSACVKDSDLRDQSPVQTQNRAAAADGIDTKSESESSSTFRVSDSYEHVQADTHSSGVTEEKDTKIIPGSQVGSM